MVSRQQLQSPEQQAEYQNIRDSQHRARQQSVEVLSASKDRLARRKSMLTVNSEKNLQAEIEAQEQLQRAALQRSREADFDRLQREQARQRALVQQLERVREKVCIRFDPPLPRPEQREVAKLGGILTSEEKRMNQNDAYVPLDAEFYSAASRMEWVFPKRLAVRILQKQQQNRSLFNFEGRIMLINGDGDLLVKHL